jgi:hypothetical protein
MAGLELPADFTLMHYHKTIFGLFIAILIAFTCPAQQIANYVSNGSFEDVAISASLSINSGVLNWRAIDTTESAFILFSVDVPFFNVPNASFGFQYPRSGKNFICTSFYRTNPGKIGYPFNRLKMPLKANTSYCAKFHVVNTNNNRIAIGSYGMHFGNYLIDTITNCTVPLTYLTPQIQSTLGIITDTLNWIPIAGTFTAAGDEKYLVLGNFKSPATTNTLLINTPTLSFMTNDIYIDDVSVIEMELPAYAGPDKYVVAGDSVYIGRETDVEIDESCIWYQMTSPTTSVTIDTIAGLYVKPVVTTTYVVRQQLWCSGVKWDTVLVHMDYVGIETFSELSHKLILHPIPAQDILNLNFDKPEFSQKYTRVQIYNELGQIVRAEEISFKNGSATLKTNDLNNGAYFLQLLGEQAAPLNKRFIINR